MTFRIFSGDTYILFQLFLAMTPPLRGVIVTASYDYIPRPRENGVNFGNALKKLNVLVVGIQKSR